MVKRYLKSGVMENGVVTETKEGSPQGGNLSPLLANVYLNEFDWDFCRRGVPCIRYADDIVLLAKSERAAERLLESSTKYLEETLKLKVNRKKSRTVSVFAIRNFKFLGFCFGKNGKGIYIRVHGKSWKKAKDKLRQLTSRSRCGSIVQTMEKIKVYMRGWLNYYGIADMKNNIESLNGCLLYTSAFRAGGFQHRPHDGGYPGFYGYGHCQAGSYSPEVPGDQEQGRLV